jgi:serine/threonine protein phosphatase PrpC
LPPTSANTLKPFFVFIKIKNFHLPPQNAAPPPTQDPTTGVSKLVAANIGDARTLLVTSKGKVTQLSFDHVPDQVGNLVLPPLFARLAH